MLTSNGLLTAVGALAAVIAVILQVYQMRRRHLVVGFARSIDLGILQESLVDIPQNVQAILTVQVDGEPVTDIQYIEFFAENVGNSPVKLEDFESAIHISAGEDAYILRVWIVDSAPTTLADHIRVQVDEATVMVSPMRLNQSESFTIGILARNMVDPSFKIRLVGMIEKHPDSLGWRLQQMVTSKFTIIALVISAFVGVLGPPITSFLGSAITNSPILPFLNTSFFQPLFLSEDFAIGLLWGVLLTLFVGLIARYYLWFSAAARRFVEAQHTTTNNREFQAEYSD